MAFISVCLKSVSNCFYGEWPHPQHQQHHPHHQPVVPIVPEVVLDTSCMGQEAVVVKNGSRLCGTGAARASTPILQNKAYWEAKIQQSGVWSCGVATPNCNLSKEMGKDSHSWILCSEGTVRANSTDLHVLDQKVQEGDVISMTYDHVELNFYLNGENLNCPVYGIKGTVFPVFYVDDGAIVDAIFDSFRCPSMPQGFDRIMVEKVLL